MSAHILRRLIAERQRRARHFDAGLFADPAWDILLDLSLAGCEGRNISVTSACIGSAVPPTTALRHIALLVECGLVEREHDPDDGRRFFLSLTEAGRNTMQSYLRDISGVTVRAAA